MTKNMKVLILKFIVIDYINIICLTMLVVLTKRSGISTGEK